MEINKQVSLDWLEMYATAEQLKTVVDKLAKGTFDSPSTQEEIAKLQNDLTYWVVETDKARKMMLEAHDRTIQAEKERDIAFKALEWYADAGHYESKPSDDDFAEWEVPDAVDDRGKRARTAIEEIRRNTDAPKDTNANT